MKKDKCIFENNKECTDCEDCNTCDLDPKEECNNCGDCLSKGDYDSKAILIDELSPEELEEEMRKDEEGNEILDFFKSQDIDLEYVEAALKQSFDESGETDEYKEGKEFLENHKELYSDYNPDNLEFIDDIENLNEVLQNKETFKKCAEEVFPGFIKLKKEKEDEDNKNTHLN